MAFSSNVRWVFFYLQCDVYKKDKQLVKDIAEFLLVHQIPAFVSPLYRGISISNCTEHAGTNSEGPYNCNGSKAC